VLRRSTTRCTWDSDLSKSARSTVTFMRNPACLGTQVRAPPPPYLPRRRGRVRRGWRLDINIGNCRADVDSTSQLARTFPSPNGQDGDRASGAEPDSSAPPYLPGRREGRAGQAGAGCHSCNWLFKTSISAARVLSTPISDSILRTACRTVVWSRPPKRRPISGNERSVSVLARYIAI